MKRAVDFFHVKLGMPILYTMEYKNDADEVIGQHWFFGVGGDGAHLAVFYWVDGYQTVPPLDKSNRPKPTNPRAYPIAELMHFNLKVDADRIEEYCNKLLEAGIPFRHTVRYMHPTRPGVMTVENKENGFLPTRDDALMTSVYLTDPDGIELEFNAWLPAMEGAFSNDAVPLGEPAKV